jgi:hypothetical protein
MAILVAFLLQPDKSRARLMTLTGSKKAPASDCEEET